MCIFYLLLYSLPSFSSYYQEKEFKLNTGWFSFIFPHCAVALDLLWTWFIKLSMPQILGVDMILTERGVVSE
jgi:hypothetical protein